ncbi:MAG: hypothetical protein C9356_11800 [Oleiphilus sp.]|nr:MAG: hypothetical protein C9356_11800 [Oleiphilus sp.]
MSITFLDVQPSLIREGCPKYVIDEAIASSRKVAKIVWDGEDVPENCFGFVQWSVRPYRVTDRCDGTRDTNAMDVTSVMCQRTNIDIRAAHKAAYPDDANIFEDPAYLSWLEEHSDQCEVQELTVHNLIELLNSLCSMNWRSLTEVCEQWSQAGYEVHEFWLADTA